MLHILLLILKIIGIVLLVILGLLLAAVLLILLVPLRYRLKGSWHGRPAGQVRVTWLLHAVSVLASYEDGLAVTAKLFGFTVFYTASGTEDEEAGEPEDEEAREWDAADSGAQEEAGWLPDESGDEFVSAMSLDDENPAADTASDAEGIDIASLLTLEEQLQQDEADAAGADTAEDALSGHTDRQEKQSGSDSQGEKTDDKQPEAEASSDDIIDKLDGIFDRIGEKLEWADGKRRWVEHFLGNPKNQKTIRLVWRQAKAIIRHILPQKAQGQITFGFDDPATTGNVLAACSVLYALYGSELTVTPDFENTVIDGELNLKGRIRPGTLAVRAVRVVIDRNLWKMIRQVRKFLESGGR